MDLPKGSAELQRDIEAWADGLLEPLTLRERTARKAEEAAAAEREARRREARAEVQVRAGWVGGWEVGYRGSYV